MKTLILIGMVVFMLCMPYTFFPDQPNWFKLAGSEAGYLAGSPCAGQAVTEACPDRSYGWQEREHGGSLSPEASGGGPGGDSGGGASGGDSGGISGGGSGTGSK